MDKNTGTYKVRATLQLSKDGETSSGPFLTEVFALDGTALFRNGHCDPEALRCRVPAITGLEHAPVQAYVKRAVTRTKYI